MVPSADQRFRKRDKIEFVARRMSRNVKAVGSLIRGGQGMLQYSILMHYARGVINGKASKAAALPQFLDTFTLSQPFALPHLNFSVITPLCIL